jgi:putative phosphoribosyl transferase
MGAQEIIIPLKEAGLGAELDLPPAASALVLFAHGSGSSRHSPRNQFVAATLRECGLGTLLFDLLTAEEERAEAFTGHLRFDIPLLAGRLLGATRWVMGDKTVRGLRLGYFGSSTGAAAALMAAAELRETISAVVSRGGRPDLAGDALPRVTAATLLIVGGNDTAVIELNRAACGRLGCEKELRVVPGASHLFEEPGTLRTAASFSATWFVRHLCPETQARS